MYEKKKVPVLPIPIYPLRHHVHAFIPSHFLPGYQSLLVRGPPHQSQANNRKYCPRKIDLQSATQATESRQRSRLDINTSSRAISSLHSIDCWQRRCSDRGRRSRRGLDERRNDSLKLGDDRFFGYDLQVPSWCRSRGWDGRRGCGACGNGVGRAWEGS